MKLQKTSRNGMSKAANDRKIKRIYLTAATVVAAVFCYGAACFFADDPLTTINNLSDFVFSAIKAIGAILLGFGIVQIGLAPQRSRCQPAGAGLYDLFSAVWSFILQRIFWT